MLVNPDHQHYRVVAFYGLVGGPPIVMFNGREVGVSHQGFLGGGVWSAKCHIFDGGGGPLGVIFRESGGGSQVSYLMGG